MTSRETETREGRKGVNARAAVRNTGCTKYMFKSASTLFEQFSHSAALGLPFKINANGLVVIVVSMKNGYLESEVVVAHQWWLVLINLMLLAWGVV